MKKIIESGIYFLGQIFKKWLFEDEFMVVFYIMIGFLLNVVQFKKIFILKCGCLVYDMEYKRLYKRN